MTTNPGAPMSDKQAETIAEWLREASAKRELLAIANSDTSRDTFLYEGNTQPFQP